jgi:uncharacterized protein (TIGR02466 family)
VSEIDRLFVTMLYRNEEPGIEPAPLGRACRAIERQDKAGQSWSKSNGYQGYTSYASLNDLPERAPEFLELVRTIDRHVADFAKAAFFDLKRRRLKCDSIWINILKPGGLHTGHIHPHSAVSGTYYVTVPHAASAIRFEDPRLGLMMASPMRRPDAPDELRSFVSVVPNAGTLLLWESWLRHEVPVNDAASDRISISFNYRWG